ncbi:hypothetical protein KAU19_02980 [Candidatus Parcubacteria bacterium]|nr:hypothetical protein [Candidatus Parcubacteria bacterium]
MRQVLSVSLPGQTIQLIKKRVKKQKFDSVSSYIKHLLEIDQNLISEDELLRSVKQARLEYRQGKTIKAKSMADFL